MTLAPPSPCPDRPGESGFTLLEIMVGLLVSVLIMAGLTAVQGLAGLGVFIAGQRPAALLHVVYGAFAVLFLPGVFLYAQNGTKRREAVILAGASWIVAIAYLRGFATG